MGRSMFNFGKNSKEIARQRKQMEKASKRMATRQNKANLKLHASDQKSDTAETNSVDDIAKASV